MIFNQTTIQEATRMLEKEATHSSDWRGKLAAGAVVLLVTAIEDLIAEIRHQGPRGGR